MVMIMSWIPSCTLCNGYTMARRDFPDIYALARGPRAWAYISGKSRLDMV